MDEIFDLATIYRDIINEMKEHGCSDEEIEHRLDTMGRIQAMVVKATW